MDEDKFTLEEWFLITVYLHILVGSVLPPVTPVNRTSPIWQFSFNLEVLQKRLIFLFIFFPLF